MKKRDINYIRRSIIIGIVQISLVLASLIISTYSKDKLISELNTFNNLTYYVADLKVEGHIYSNVYYEYKVGIDSNSDYRTKLAEISDAMLSDLDNISIYANPSGKYYSKILSTEDDVYKLSNALAKDLEYSEVVDIRQSLISKLSSVETVIVKENTKEISRYQQLTTISQGLSIFVVLTLISLFIANIRSLIDFKKNMEEQGMLESCIDELTRLWNRKYVDQILPDMAEKSNHGYLFMVDMDHFKQVNDTLGHDAGDEVLKDFANIAKNCLRPTDIICRLGGDEFMIFSANISKDEQAKVIYKRLTKAIRQRFDGTPKDIVTLSCGAVAYDKSISFRENYKRADSALYHVKENGRNNFFILK